MRTLDSDKNFLRDPCEVISINRSSLKHGHGYLKIEIPNELSLSSRKSQKLRSRVAEFIVKNNPRYLSDFSSEIEFEGEYDEKVQNISCCVYIQISHQSWIGTAMGPSLYSTFQKSFRNLRLYKK